LIRYPNRIKPSKVIETAHSSVDFTPTILKLMDIEHAGHHFHGYDVTPELLSEEMITNQESIVFSSDSSARWAAAVTKGYKLVVSKADVPWLFDLTKDPDEIYNYFEDPSKESIRQKLQNALFSALHNYKIPLAQVDAFLWDFPSCRDSNNVIKLNNGKKILCSELGISESMGRCEGYYKVRNMCPVKCSKCACEDSPGKVWVHGELKTCSEIIQNECLFGAVNNLCRLTCGSC
jgi:hypothetical protein